MKKSLLLCAALAPAMFAMAEGKIHTYDFNTHGIFAAFQDPNDPFNYQEKLANYDFIDKYGKTVNTDGEQMCYYTLDENGGKVWHAVTNRVVSLEDGQTYMLRTPDDSNTALANTEAGFVSSAPDNGVIPADHVFLGWDEDGVGPARCLHMPGWGSLDAWADVNYNTALEADWVSTKHGFQMSRQGNNASRKQTYLQFPAMEAPLKVTAWIGTPLGKYASELRMKVTPVQNGVAGEPIISSTAGDQVVAKRFYKKTVDVPGEGKMAVRIGCDNHELLFLHITIEEGAVLGIDDIIANPVDDENAPAYNVLGQRVNDDYKGLVIKNGKKLIRK